jgi:hypothetical protein
MQLVTSTMNYKSCTLFKGWIIYINYQTPTTLSFKSKDVQPTTKLKPNTQKLKSIEIGHAQAT